MLAQICRGKRVILVSATPLNNTPRDILSQVKLFQNGKNSTIPNVRNLEAFFARLEKNLNGLDRQRDREQYFKTVQANAKATREQILKFLMIRRTRSEIMKYYGEDLQLQGLKFPDVADPQPLFYKFSKTENEIFNETVLLLTKEFTYARYKPLTYYEGNVEEGRPFSAVFDLYACRLGDGYLSLWRERLQGEGLADLEAIAGRVTTMVPMVRLEARASTPLRLEPA